MEEQPSKEVLEKELQALQEIQNAKGKELAEKKKAKATKEDLSPLLEELKKVKEDIKAHTAKLHALYPEVEKEKTAKPGVNEAKEKRAAEAKAAQAKGRKPKGKKKQPGKEKKAEFDTRDVTKAVLDAPFAGTRFRPNDPRVLPVSGKRNVLITSALPYVNNVPHLGNIIGCVLSADVFARYCRLRQINTLFVCGTDEYGTATETKALQEGVTPLEICNKFSKIHDEIYQWFGISFDHFGRTTTPEQKEIAQDIFLKLHQNDYLVGQTVEQLYCPTCDRYLADRLVEGTCHYPDCGYAEARGDQCDKCGRLINAVELINPRCKHDGTTPVKRNSDHLYLDLPKLTDKLEPWIKDSSVKGNWTANGVAITNSWLSTGLQPRCITRDLKWGTPVPIEKYAGKVFYVWFDAPIGYISITATYTKEWEKWWKNPSQVQLYQFMGKDNIPFHTVIFPSSLLGTHEDWTLLHHVSTTEFLNYENKQGQKDKFSKSRNLGVFGDGVQSTGIPQEVWRYYLLSCRPENSDTMFSWHDLAAKNNAELLGNLGNFCNRCLAFTNDRLDGIVPRAGALTEADQATIQRVNEQLALYISALDEVKIKEGLRIAVIEIATEGNGYLQSQKPWELIKTDKERCGTVLALSLNLTTLLGVLLEPYLPSFTEKLLGQLALPHIPIPDSFSLALVPAGHKLGESAPIFRKLEDAEVKGLQAVFG